MTIDSLADQLDTLRHRVLALVLDDPTARESVERRLENLSAFVQYLSASQYD